MGTRSRVRRTEISWGSSARHGSGTFDIAFGLVLFYEASGDLPGGGLGLADVAVVRRDGNDHVLFWDEYDQRVPQRVRPGMPVHLIREVVGRLVHEPAARIATG